MADEKAAPLPLPLPAVSVEKEEEEEEEEEEKKKKHAPADPPTFPGVRHVIVWALLSAGCVAFSIAYTLIVPKCLLPRPRPGHEDVTDAEVDVAGALAAGMLCCAVSQAATGVLGLMLRPPRHRLLLAYAALVATAAGHCMWAGLHSMFVAADGGLRFWTAVTCTAVIFFSGVVDLSCFRGLIFGGGEEE